MPFRDDQRVVFAHGIAIAACVRTLPFLNQLVIAEITKQTIFHFSHRWFAAGLEVEWRQIRLLSADGGEGGIRTHGTFRYNGFRDRHNKPSSATSPKIYKFDFSYLMSCKILNQNSCNHRNNHHLR